MQITILTAKTSWMDKYLPPFKSQLEQLGHIVSIISKSDDLKKGDIAFFLSCFEIIPPEKLILHKNNLVVHASDLPSGKGWSPMSWQILEGKNNIPLTLFEINEKVDAGDIYLKDTISLNGNELISEWQDVLAKKIIELCFEFINNYSVLITCPQKQIGVESFYKKRTPEDSKLDINKSIKEQFNLLRIVDNQKYPAFFELNGQKYIIKVEKL